MRKAFADTLMQLATDDGRIAFVTGDLGFQVFDEFERRFGGRYINVGVAEAQMIYAAAGMAMEGWKPVAYSIASFATARPFEQIRYCIAYPNLPIVLVGAGRGYLYSSSGVSHHAGDDLALMTTLPNMTVVAPGDPEEIAQLLPQVVALDSPSYFTVGRFGEPSYEAPGPAVLGKARLLRDGQRVAIVGTGEIANEILKAHALLSQEGIRPIVYQMHTVKPLDTATLDMLAESLCTILVVEEHVPSGGLWSAVAGWNVQRARPCLLHRLGAPDRFALGNLRQQELRRRWQFDAEAIATACRRLWTPAPGGQERGRNAPTAPRSRIYPTPDVLPAPRVVDDLEFLELVGSEPSELPASCGSRLRGRHLRYRPLSRRERDEHIRHILGRLDTLATRPARENYAAFQDGWEENLEMCAAAGVSWETLKPRYVKPFPVVRYRDDFVAPQAATFVDDLLSTVLAYAFEKYLAASDTVYEFGCGTGRYLFLIRELFPSKSLVGLDWTEASLGILRLMGQRGIPVEGIRFDMLEPDEHVRLKPGSAVITVSSLEQLGDRFRPFLKYLLSRNPSVVVHHEPIEEFYASDDLLDGLAREYHRRRGYLSGYWTELKQLEEHGQIEILDARRTHFGDPYHDGMSLVAWRPR